MQPNPAAMQMMPPQFQQPNLQMPNIEDIPEDPDFEMSEAQKEAEKTMNDDQRNRFLLLTSGNSTKIPKPKVKEIMRAVAPENTTISDEVAHYASIATRLFVAELVETAKQFHSGRGPLIPEDIMLSFRKLEEEGKIPGRSSGTRRQYMK